MNLYEILTKPWLCPQCHKDWSNRNDVMSEQDFVNFLLKTDYGGKLWIVTITAFAEGKSENQCKLRLTIPHSTVLGTRARTVVSVHTCYNVALLVKWHMRAAAIQQSSDRDVVIASWWRHQMETFSALLAICVGNSPVPTQRPVTRSFDVFFDLRQNKRLSKQSWGWWFEMLPRPSWRHYNGERFTCFRIIQIPVKT